MRVRGLSSLKKSDRNERKASGFGCVLQNENLVRKILQVTKRQGWEVFMVLIFLTGLTEFTGLRLVGVWSSSGRVELEIFWR